MDRVVPTRLAAIDLMVQLVAVEVMCQQMISVLFRPVVP